MPDIYHPGRVPDWFYGGAPSSQPGLGAALQPHPPPNATTPGTGGTGTPTLPDFSEIGNLIGQINATNQAAHTSAANARIPNGPQLEQLSSNSIASLLNPPQQLSEIDTGAAARALGSGTTGSPFAGNMGTVLNENERIRRQGIGQQFLTGALARNPAAPIADTQQLVQFLAQQRFQAQQDALNRALQAQIAQLHYNHGGYGPQLPTSYGHGAAGPGGFFANIPSGVSPYYNPDEYSGGYDLPDTSGSTITPQSPDLYDLPDFTADYSAYA